MATVTKALARTAAATSSATLYTVPTTTTITVVTKHLKQFQVMHLQLL